MLMATTAIAQEDRKQLVVPLSSAGFVAFKIETVSTGTKTSSGSIEATTIFNPLALTDQNHVIHRVLVSQAGDFVFGYDLRVEPDVDSKKFRVAVHPLSAEFARQFQERDSSPDQSVQAAPKIRTLSSSTEMQLIEDGDAFSLDLLINPSAGLKIVDMVKFSFNRANLWELPARPPTRDFTLANVELAVRDYKLLVNDELAAGGKPTRGCEGALVWFYVPGKGRFIFSLIPHSGYDFRKVGVIEENRISFTLGGDRYEWISSAPIVGNGGNWNLWVLYDPGYIPIPEFYPPARDTRKETKSPGFIPSIISSLADRLPGVKGKEQQAGHPTRPAPANGQELDQYLKRARISIGAADRIENLWPKN
jgi:hypothetical protein